MSRMFLVGIYSTPTKKTYETFGLSPLAHPTTRGKGEWADKPGSVEGRPFISNGSRLPPLARNPDTRRATAWYPYLRLLQMGFAKPCRCRHAGALLPHRFSFSPVETGEFSFLWHFPSSCPAQPLAGILPCGARTFLACDAYAAVWPTRMLYSSATPKSRYNFQPKGTVLFGYQVGES